MFVDQLANQNRNRLLSLSARAAIRRRRRYWLLFVLIIAELLPLFEEMLMILSNNPDPLDWKGVSLSSGPTYMLLVLSGSLISGLGPVLSILPCWFLLVNLAERVVWWRGLLAGIIANFLAYPLTAFFMGLFLLLKHLLDEGLQGLDGQLMFLFILPFLSLIGLVMFGIFTMLFTAALGSLLGWLQERDEARLRSTLMDFS